MFLCNVVYVSGCACVRRTYTHPHHTSQTRILASLEKDWVSAQDMVLMSRRLVQAVESQGCLPANLSLGERRIGLSQFGYVAARAYRMAADSEGCQRFRIHDMPRYPDAAHDVDNWIRRQLGEHWGLSPEHSCQKLSEQAMLQTWTLKPAWLTPPQSDPPADRRITLETPARRPAEKPPQIRNSSNGCAKESGEL